MINDHVFADRDSLVAALADDCITRLRSAIEQRRAATMLVSGGRSPVPLYQLLAAADLDWSSVTVALVDERWVNSDHSGSNEALVTATLLQRNAAAARFVAMKNAAATAALGWQHCEQAYRQLLRPFDVTILGMGPDGHTASLFPAADGLQTALAADSDHLCAAITARPSAVTGDLVERMSLTYSGLLQSRQLHLIVTGEDKQAVYQQALANRDHSAMPVSALLQQDKIPVLVYRAP